MYTLLSILICRAAAGSPSECTLISLSAATTTLHEVMHHITLESSYHLRCEEYWHMAVPYVDPIVDSLLFLMASDWHEADNDVTRDRLIWACRQHRIHYHVQDHQDQQDDDIHDEDQQEGT